MGYWCIFHLRLRLYSEIVKWLEFWSSKFSKEKLRQRDLEATPVKSDDKKCLNSSTKVDYHARINESLTFAFFYNLCI